MKAKKIIGSKITTKLFFFAIYFFVSFFFVWPLPKHLTTHLALGCEINSAVPLLNLWTLGWNIDRISHQMRNYWDAPIFYPLKGAFAFADPQPLSGLLAMPFWSFSPSFSYNIILLLFLTLNALSVYSLMLNRKFSKLASFMTGTLVLSLTFLTQHRGVLQLQPIFGAVFAIDSLWNLAERPRWRYGVGFGLGVAITFLTSEYYGLFLAVILLPVVFIHFFTFTKKNTWIPILLGLVIISMLVLPVVLPQRKILNSMGFKRSVVTIQHQSASITEMISLPRQVLGKEIYPSFNHEGKELSPGHFIMLLGVIGAIVGVRRRSSIQVWTMFLIIGVLITLVCSLGLNLKVFDWAPYKTLQEVIPFFNNLRSPYRFAVFFQLFFVLLAGVFLQVLIKARFLKWAIILFIVALIETFPLPVRLYQVPKFSKVSPNNSPAVILPFSRGGYNKDDGMTSNRMYKNLASGIQLGNGYSGLLPHYIKQMGPILDDFPSILSLNALRAAGFKTVMVDKKWLKQWQLNRINERILENELGYEGTQDELLIFNLKKGEINPISEYRGTWDIQTHVKEKALLVVAYPNIMNDEVYIFAPEIAPLEWEVSISLEDGTSIIDVFNAKGSVLLYRNSEYSIMSLVPMPHSNVGRNEVTLIEGATGRVLYQEEVSLVP